MPRKSIAPFSSDMPELPKKSTRLTRPRKRAPVKTIAPEPSVVTYDERDTPNPLTSIPALIGWVGAGFVLFLVMILLATRTCWVPSIGRSFVSPPAVSSTQDSVVSEGEEQGNVGQPQETIRVEPPTPEQIAELVKNEGARIEIRNGTRNNGLAKNLAAEFKQAGLQVIVARDAQSKNYAFTTVSIPKGVQAYPYTVEKITGMLKYWSIVSATGTAAIPAAEKNVQGDILVIIGKDFE